MKFFLFYAVLLALLPAMIYLGQQDQTQLERCQNRYDKTTCQLLVYGR